MDLERLVIEKDRVFIEEPIFSLSLLTFDKSQERLRSAGYERHLTPAEYCQVLQTQRNLLETKEHLIFYNMQWLAAAAQLNDNNLTIYIQPEGIIWKEGIGYVIDKELKFADKKEFKVKVRDFGDEKRVYLIEKENPRLANFLFETDISRKPTFLLYLDLNGDNKVEPLMTTYCGWLPLGAGEKAISRGVRIKKLSLLFNMLL